MTTISKSQSLTSVSIKDCTLRVPNETTTLFLLRVIIKAIFIHTLRTQTPYGNIGTGFWKWWLVPPSWIPSTFVRRCQVTVPIGFCLLDQLSIAWVCRLRGFGFQPHIAPIHNTPCKLQRSTSDQCTTRFWWSGLTAFFFWDVFSF